MDQPELNEVSPQDKRKIQKLKLRVRHLDEELIQAKDLKADYDLEFAEMEKQLRIKLGLEKEEEKKPEEKSGETSSPQKQCNINPDQKKDPAKDFKPPPRDEEDPRHEIENSSASAPSWMKKAYKQIAMKTHPDRVAQDASLSPYQVAEYKRLFETAKNAMQVQNGGDIAYVAEQLNIDAGIPSTMRISLLFTRAEKVKAEILKIYKAPQWIWGEAHGNRAMQKKVVETYCQLFKYRVPNDSFIDELLDKLESQ